jgi:hypothetical protein
LYKQVNRQNWGHLSRLGLHRYVGRFLRVILRGPVSPSTTTTLDYSRCSIREGTHIRAQCAYMRLRTLFHPSLTHTWSAPTHVCSRRLLKNVLSLTISLSLFRTDTLPNTSSQPTNVVSLSFCTYISKVFLKVSHVCSSSRIHPKLETRKSREMNFSTQHYIPSVSWI